MSELAVRDEPQQMQVVEKVNEVAAIIQVIERAAMNPDVDIDKMERLFLMQERIVSRNAKQAFNSDLALMQSEVPSITERGEISIRGAVQSKFAKFEDINDVMKPIMQRFGFAMSFRTKFEGGMIIVTGILSHKLGHSEETSMILPADNTGNKNAVQSVGSTVSYGKRYTMCAMLNITSRGEDDDGGKPAVKAPMAAPQLSQHQVDEIIMALDVAGIDQAEFLKVARVETVQEITQDRFLNCKKWIQKKAIPNADTN